MLSPDELTLRFRERGLKITPQRQAVFRALHGDDTHPTAEVVHARVAAEMPSVSLRTVYQTLNDLAAMHEILHLDLGTGASRFDPNVEVPHHHLVCEECSQVRDLHAEIGPLALEGMPEGFEVNGTELVIRGLCAECRERRDAATRQDQDRFHGYKDPTQRMERHARAQGHPDRVQPQGGLRR